MALLQGDLKNDLPSVDVIWMESTIKMLLLLGTAISVHVSLSPPNPSIKSDECCSGDEGTDTMFERFVQSITYCSKCMAWIGASYNIFGILVEYVALSIPAGYSFETGWFESVSSEWVTPHTRVPDLMIYGALMTIVGAALRVWCFKCMGPFFTFEITIRPKHELITHGPYAWVRHPSYTGVYLTLTGATMVLGSPGTWMAKYLVHTPLGWIVSSVWLLKCGFAFRGMCVRLKAEDKVLKDTFGTEWEDYASRVPFKFVPGVV